MVKIDIRLFEEQPQLFIDDSDGSRAPLLALGYSGFQLYLSKSALLQLKQALKIGEVMLKNYRRFKTIPLPFDFD